MSTLRSTFITESEMERDFVRPGLVSSRGMRPDIVVFGDRLLHNHQHGSTDGHD